MAKSKKGKRKFKYEVEDHGNGFMVIRDKANALEWPKFQGVTPDEARKVLRDYVDDVEPYKFACPTHYDGRSACWLSIEPGALWDGATDHAGRPIR